jgi:SAM-dependent methyltransferase
MAQLARKIQQAKLTRSILAQRRLALGQSLDRWTNDDRRNSAPDRSERGCTEWVVPAALDVDSPWPDPNKFQSEASLSVIANGKSWLDAMHGYDDTLRSLVGRYPDADILELGGGRRPSFRLEDMPSNLKSYTVNDISEAELSLVPGGYDKACFDVGGDASAFEGRYDVVFSRFLAEHVRDGRALHRNVYKVLKPGGVAFHLIPTLFALPFVINRLLPERIGQKMLDIFSSRREISPKFPAYYSRCYGDTAGMRRLFKNIGYDSVEIRNFYGHFYYEEIPGLRELEKWFSELAARRQWSAVSSYAYIFALK